MAYTACGRVAWVTRGAAGNIGIRSHHGMGNINGSSMHMSPGCRMKLLITVLMQMHVKLLEIWRGGFRLFVGWGSLLSPRPSDSEMSGSGCHLAYDVPLQPNCSVESPPSITFIFKIQNVCTLCTLAFRLFFSPPFHECWNCYLSGAVYAIVCVIVENKGKRHTHFWHIIGGYQLQNELY